MNYASIFLCPFIDAFAAAFDGASAISVVDASVFPVRFGTFCLQVLSQFSIQMARSLKGYQSHLRLIWDRTHLRQTDIPVQGFDIFGGVLGAELRPSFSSISRSNAALSKLGPNSPGGAPVTAVPRSNFRANRKRWPITSSRSPAYGTFSNVAGWLPMRVIRERDSSAGATLNHERSPHHTNV